MNIFLSVHYHLQTNLNESEVMNLLKKNVDQESKNIEVGFGNSSSKRFIGKIKKDTFEARLALRYRNSFTPILFGKIEASNNGSTDIFLKLRPHLGVKFFFLFWFLVFVGGTVSLSLSELIAGNFFSITHLFVLIPISVFFLFTYLFKKEVKLSKETLILLLDARCLN